jgi:hypothetical protein
MTLGWQDAVALAMVGAAGIFLVRKALGVVAASRSGEGCGRACAGCGSKGETEQVVTIQALKAPGRASRP